MFTFPDEEPKHTAPVPLVYPDGDTRIAFQWGVYVLHSNILSLKSEYLRGLFRWPSGSPENHSSIKWTLVLSKDSFLTLANDENKEPVSVKDEFFDEAASYHCFIRALYGLRLHDDMETLLNAARIADRYLALRGFQQPAIEKLVDRSLQTTMTAISYTPLDYLELGHKLGSVKIFQEAFVHCVGRFAQICAYPAFQDLPSRVQEVLEKEYERLKELRTETWMKIWGIAPENGTTAVSTNIHQAFRWYSVLQEKDSVSSPKYEGKYARLLALALNTNKRPAKIPGATLNFKVVDMASASQFSEITRPLIQGTMWSKVCERTPYLLCAKVDLTLLDIEE